MKNFVAGSGGRYVYTEDFENLQVLALSIGSIFEGCDNFIISGCQISGSTISSGYVWINKNIRHFEGGNISTYPYYIYESNSYESTEYKDEPNKLGRINYLCTGSTIIPSVNDPITGSLPSFIEITASYMPRINDKFFGKYSLILDHPFSKQSIAKNVEVIGDLMSKKNISANQSISVANSTTGYALKSVFKPNGDSSVGMYLNNALLTEVVLTTNGVIKFFKGSTEIASVSDSGISTNKSFFSTSFNTANMTISSNQINNYSDTSDQGAIVVNISGYNAGTSKFRNFEIYDGKGYKIFAVNGKDKGVSVNSGLDINTIDPVLRLSNIGKNKDDISLINEIKFNASDTQIGSIGFAQNGNKLFYVVNSIGDIELTPQSSVNIKGGLKINSVDISTIFVSQTDYETGMQSKVNIVDGMGLSAYNFTKDYKDKLDKVVFADIEQNKDGLINLFYVQSIVAGKLSKSANLADLADKGAARVNLGVPSISDFETALSLKLDASKAYSGEIFTTGYKTKLDSITEGRFEGVNDEGGIIPKINGYVTVNKILYELNKYAPLLLGSYTADQKKTVASNINVYNKEESDNEFAKPSKIWDDHIAYIVSKQNKTAEEARSILRSKIGSPSVNDLDAYIKKNSLLSDLVIENDTAKKNICNRIGAAYAQDYQPKIVDTGWKPVSGLPQLFARQIGDIVSVQGRIQTPNNSSTGNMLGSIGNEIAPPKYAVSFNVGEFRDAQYNRGIEIIIDGGSRSITIGRSYAFSNVTIPISFTYMV